MYGNETNERTDKSKLVVSTFNTYFMWDGLKLKVARSTVVRDQQGAYEHMEDIAFVIKTISTDICNH